jgi:hypothetical protein
MATVELKVKSGLKTILDDLESLRAKAEEVSKELENTGKQTSAEIKKSTKETETFFGNLKNYGRRVSDQLKRDFKSLVSIESLGAGLKISSQFKDSIRETVQLSDAIRKLGPVFGMAERDFVTFQKTLMDGLGEIGMSSDVAAETLKGLSQTQVRGSDNLTAYSVRAGQFASIANERGKEGEIAKGMANVIRSRGGDVNDKKQMDALAESMRRVFLTTRDSPIKILQDLDQMFQNMPQDLRKAIDSTSLSNIAVISATAGDGAAKFLADYLSQSPKKRMAFEAQGGAGIFGPNGLNVEKFKNFARSIMGRIVDDPRLAAETLGISPEAAEGMVRLAESIDQVSDAQKRMQTVQGDINQTYRDGMGLGENFRASINRIKALFAEPLSAVTQGMTNMLSDASKTDIGAGAVVAGGGVLAALLAGGGLKGIGAGLLGTVAKSAAAEEITGQKTVPVYVTNAAEIAAGGGLMGAAGGLGFLGRAGAIGLAGLGGVALGQAIEPTVSQFLKDNTTDTTSEGFRGDIIERLFFKLDMLLGGDTTAAYRAPPAPTQKVKVEFNTPLLRETKQPNRGASN